MAGKSEDRSDAIYVFFPEATGKKLGTKPVRTVVQRLQAAGAYRAIIVLEVGITPIAAQVRVFCALARPRGRLTRGARRWK